MDLADVIALGISGIALIISLLSLWFSGVVSYEQRRQEVRQILVQIQFIRKILTTDSKKLNANSRVEKSTSTNELRSGKAQLHDCRYHSRPRATATKSKDPACAASVSISKSPPTDRESWRSSKRTQAETEALLENPAEDLKWTA